LKSRRSPLFSCIEFRRWRQYEEQVHFSGATAMSAAAESPRPDGATLARSEQLDALSDAQLLARFFRDRQDRAFSAIVARHGPLVLGVCRRVLRDANDAEDAFQATFLVLVRKGAGLRDPERLPSWLYGVAYRTARKVKTRAALRSKLERQASEMPTKSDPKDLTYSELQAVLDEEISRLPGKYALPLVLCYLEGKTNAQAAAQLGWPEGSMSRRLSRARELLRSRLARRGLALSAALLTAVFARPATAAIPHTLLAATTRAATLAAEGYELHDVVSPATAQVAEEVVAGLSAGSKFAIPTILVIASLLLVLTTAVWQFGSPVHAASFLNFGRGLGVHALTTTQTSGGATLIGGGEGSCCSTLAPPACGEPAAP
jgi:RNA polymerase sigma factor (sigma-70 family)